MARPERDWYDHFTLGLGILGFFAVVATIIVTLISNSENGKDTANAISAMENISEEMRNDRPILENQMIAAQDAALAAADSASSTKSQADASRDQANAAIGQARAAVALAKSSEIQLSQSAKQFALQQRPVLVFVRDVADGVPTSNGKKVIWRFRYENVGASPSFNLKLYQAFKVGDAAFQRQIMEAPRILATRDPKISIAQFEGDVPAGPIVFTNSFALAIVFKYQDAGGKTYTDTFCGETIPPDTLLGVCDYRYDDQLAKDPAWPRVKVVHSKK